MAQPQKSNQSIKILSVVWYKVLPPRFGGQRAVAMFNDHLSSFVPLICLCSRNNLHVKSGYEIQNSLPVSKWQFLNPLVWRKIYAVAKREEITEMILEFPYHGIAGFICKKWLGIQLITNTHNIEFLRFKAQKKWWWRLLYYFEKWVLKGSDKVFFKTAIDCELAGKYFNLSMSRVAVVPYGCESKAKAKTQEAKAILQSRYGIDPETKIFLFAGTLDYQPNAEAVVQIHDKLLPFFDAANVRYKIFICGRNEYPAYQYLTRLENEQLLIVGNVDDIETYFLGADVFLNPVLSGGGVQTKIIDALSYHLNTVCFQSKCMGITGAGEKLACVEDGNWRAFADAALKMSNVNTPTPSLFFETYHWPSIAARAYKTITDR